MQLEARKYLYDIQEAAGLASQFTAGKSFADYQQNAMLRMAVERAFAIIGEALVQLAWTPPWQQRLPIFAASLPFAIFWFMPMPRWMNASSGTSSSRNCPS
jgi:hypothetical protein